METNAGRVERLTQYVKGVLEKRDGTMLYNEYKEDLEKVTPQEAFEIFSNQIQRGIKPKEILEILDKVIHVFNKSLIKYQWKKPEKGSFLDALMKENEALEEKLSAIKEIIKKKDFKNNKDDLLKRIEELQQFDDHYLKKENILFPYLEKKMKKFEGLSIMWALHDEARASLKKLIYILKSEEASETDFNVEIGNLLFILYGLVYKEKYILFPSAMEVIDDKEWYDMKKQSYEYGFPFIERPPIEKDDIWEEEDKVVKQGQELVMKTETGEISFQQALMIFNALPVDLTYVDENNKVRFFTRPKDRIFPRSPAAIGRDVRNCHPPQSVHVVENIIDEFRKGHKDSATFWIQMKERTILIQYFAMKDSEGQYKGVLEVSQDITEIKKIEGEKRLLEWQ
ncbi:DUF438 domain-containing protein [Lutispora thermophila]|uniref:PAC domain-containing protein n=1 Tax=Lutispora thermophila DSM 19022 TaxID=1122184 RepID=A0A1M6H472_9FIRM|nr:PAS domain-containing protein [Lutispora thermophila]SHJ16919.1 hypothetical protein SAMN02745176_02642 [Lutispora thermophila DSM 19022]